MFSTNFLLRVSCGHNLYNLFNKWSKGDLRLLTSEDKKASNLHICSILQDNEMKSTEDYK